VGESKFCSFGGLRFIGKLHLQANAYFCLSGLKINQSNCTRKKKLGRVVGRGGGLYKGLMMICCACAAAEVWFFLTAFTQEITGRRRPTRWDTSTQGRETWRDGRYGKKDVGARSSYRNRGITVPCRRAIKQMRRRRKVIGDMRER